MKQKKNLELTKPHFSGGSGATYPLSHVIQFRRLHQPLLAAGHY